MLVKLYGAALIFACLLIPIGTEARTGLVCIGLLGLLTLRDEVFEGLVYRTTSSPWPAGYDPNRLASTNVGFFRVEFTNGTAAFDFTAEGQSNRFTISRQPF